MKKIIIAITILVLLVLLIPFPNRLNDGGTVHYNAIIYDVYDVHKIKPPEKPFELGIQPAQYIYGKIIKIFGIEVFNNTNPRVDY